jgi:hypothetical protein
MLNAHDALSWTVGSAKARCLENGLILEIWQLNIYGGRRFLLEAQLAIQGHVF